MGKIKSALEIALERTESVASSKTSIGQFELKQKGKRIANEYLQGTVELLEAELKKVSGEELTSLKQGIFDIFITQVVLPAGKDELQRVEAAAMGLHVIIGAEHFGEIVKQVSRILSQYLDEVAQHEEAIKKQYAPKLRKKEEDISRRLGRHVKLDPFQDPEFVAFFNQNINALKEKYEDVVVQVREEAKRLFEDPE